MSDLRITLAALLLAALAAGAAAWLARGRRARRALPAPGPRRVLFPFVGSALSRPALEAALRLARADGATLVPVYLAEVPLHLPLDTALPRASARALTLLEVIEQRAHRCGVPVDARIERGRDARHALRELLDHERYDRIVLPAAADGDDGFTPALTAWLLDHASGEVVVLRPAAPPAPPAPVTAPGRPACTAAAAPSPPGSALSPARR